MTPRRGTLLAAAAVAAGLTAILATGIVLAGGGSAGPAPDGSVAAEAGPPAPELSGTDPITGKPVSLADFEGKPVVVNVWASWCTGCKEEAADLRRFADAHPEAVVLGIDTQDTVADAKRFYRRFGWTHPSIFDPKGELAARLELIGLPTTIFLSPEHGIVSRIVGATDLAGFEAALARAKAAT